MLSWTSVCWRFCFHLSKRKVVQIIILWSSGKKMVVRGSTDSIRLFSRWISFMWGIWIVEMALGISDALFSSRIDAGQVLKRRPVSIFTFSIYWHNEARWFLLQDPWSNYECCTDQQRTIWSLAKIALHLADSRQYRLRHTLFQLEYCHRRIEDLHPLFLHKLIIKYLV